MALRWRSTCDRMFRKQFYAIPCCCLLYVSRASTVETREMWSVWMRWVCSFECVLAWASAERIRWRKWREQHTRRNRIMLKNFQCVARSNTKHKSVHMSGIYPTWKNENSTFFSSGSKTSAFSTFAMLWYFFDTFSYFWDFEFQNIPEIAKNFTWHYEISLANSSENKIW